MVKKSSKNKKIVRHNNKKNTSEISNITSIIATIIALFFSVFAAMSNNDMCGEIGLMVKNLLLTFFGTYGYFFPLVIFASIFIYIFGRNKRNVNIKDYGLILLYISLICIRLLTVDDFSNIESLVDTFKYSRKENIVFSLSGEDFYGGIIGNSIVFVLQKAIGKAGSFALFITLIIISIVFIMGLRISRYIVTIFTGIIFFVPKMIDGIRKSKEENRIIEIENENLLNEVIEKSKFDNINKNVTYKKNNEYKVDESLFLNKKTSRNVLESHNEEEVNYNKLSQNIENENIKKDFSKNERFSVTPKDIKSLFYESNTEKIKNNAKKSVLSELNDNSFQNVYKEKNNDNEQVKYDIFDSNENKTFNEFDDNLNDIKIKNEQSNILFRNNVENKIEKTVLKNDNLNNNQIYPIGNDVLDNNSINNSIIDDKKFDLNFSTNNDDALNIKIRKFTKKYKYPPLSFLNRSENKSVIDKSKLNDKARILKETLDQFGVGVEILNITVGPSVTRYELKPTLGVKVSKILNLQDDIKLALAASEIRIEAPIPGKSAIGIEIPNDKKNSVNLYDILSSREFKDAESKLTVAIGKDISGKTIVADLRKMPHLLIAGATGSGKSVCINSLIMSILYKASPEDVRLILVDPKVVELQIYNGIPHLYLPVVTDPKKASNALNWAVNEMMKRYQILVEKNVRDIESYNSQIEIENKKIQDEQEKKLKLPYIVIIIDEFADLMMVASKDVENNIFRIAQLARACGIYLIIATQRPSVNVISGSIKTNVPSRISFAVSSGVDSQTILDRRGAERLIGHGDMLYFPQGIPEPIRVQGCFVTEEEILKVINYIKDMGVNYDEEVIEKIESNNEIQNTSKNTDEKDEMFFEAGKLCIEMGNASIGLLQRRFRMGFNRAARIIDQLEEAKVISSQDGKKSREILMQLPEFIEKFK